MRQKFVFAMVVSMCLALAFGPALSAERSIDDRADRVTRGERGTTNDVDSTDVLGEFAHISEQGRVAGSATATRAKAENLLSAAAKLEGQDAVTNLQRILALGDVGDKILGQTYTMLADVYADTPSKGVQLLGRALQYTSDPGRRARLEQRIADLGGDVFAIAFDNNTDAVATRDAAGPSCDMAAPALASETMNVAAGDHNWRVYNISGTFPVGEQLRVETVSDTPGGFSDDTDLTVWAGCDGAAGAGQIAYNDDSPLANAPFMSLIDLPCLAGGSSLYIEVGGFLDIFAVDGFDLVISGASCVVPQLDDYEDDSARADGASIGHPNAIPHTANGWGRAKKEIQDRSIFPSGDIDHAQVALTKNSLVRMGTASEYPTFFNGFSGSGATDNPDTIMNLLYQTELGYGGRCNTPVAGFGYNCTVDADCADVINDPDADGLGNPEMPLAGFPDCIPIFLFNSPFGEENVLATNDDRGGGDFGSELLLCMPRTAANSDDSSVNGDWVVQTFGWSPSGAPGAGAGEFNYQLQVKNEVDCNFEKEPNDLLADATPMSLGDTVHGIFDYASSRPFQDDDYFAFDIDDEVLAIFQTDGYDSNAVDTALQLFIGPDDNGDFFFLGVENDDFGTGFLSRIEVILPASADDLLGNTSADANYIMNVTSFFLNPNFPYTLITEAASVPLAEAEPNDDCSTANAIAVGDSFASAINPGCDFDSYKLSLGDSTFVSLATSGGGDTAIELVDCADDTVLACDDDEGPGLLSLVEGCLPAGEYCIRVRAFSGAAVFSYGLDVAGSTGCAPTNPPDMSGDGAFTCLDFDTCP
ncbi:MAG: hypothetical protein OEV00_01175 [Acidobacteriota bacterium]|nr:hypothetical protein [Acidobacteriota bacterium]MDH3783917.1 hypothetical protein [Acidobacteriota bacterium]